ncbi:tetratricopeptide repeat protein [Microbulbifer agarilyticus]|uniref:tetratricopeptide repeat protein n=1 Tax=Microbulbifer agarilyticus TaxID=260552 RepID=UPI001C93EC2C|nr:tetratricopeptide repeat protein [Microbulbifer agarilyticus]MBY6191290.1 tetratricopeptide repeat protein [Microbulbifer agarilyticus]
MNVKNEPFIFSCLAAAILVGLVYGFQHTSVNHMRETSDGKAYGTGHIENDICEVFTGESLEDAYAYFKKQELKKAENAYLNVLSQNPECFSALISLGAVYSTMERLPEAKDLYFRALDINENNAALQQSLGVLIFKSVGAKESLPYFQRAIELDPKLDAAHWGIGNSYYFLGEYERSKFHLRSFVELQPSSNLAKFANQRIAEIEQRGY